MKAKSIKYILLALIIGLGLNAFAYDDGDWQIWNNAGIDLSLSNQWKLKIEEEVRYDLEAGSYYYNHADASLHFKLTKIFSISAGYRHIYEQSNDIWKDERSPNFEGTFKWGWKKMSFEQKNRMEHRQRDGKPDSWRYNNKFTISSPLTVSTRCEWQPFLSDEISYDFKAQEWSRNRLSSGINVTFTKAFKASLYYMWQITKQNTEWIDLNVAVFKITISA